jgi:predicted MFS family arabinose efflux permease
MTASEQTGRASLRSWWMLGVLTLIGACSYVDRYALAVIIEPMKADLKLTDGDVGLLLGLGFAVAYSLAALPLGRLVDTTRRTRLLALCVTVWSLSTAAFGVAGHFFHLLLARIGVATGESGAFMNAQSLIADGFPPHRRVTALSIYGLGSMAGQIAGFALAGLVAEWLGWRGAFVMIGALGLPLAALLLWTVPEPVRGATDVATTATPEVPSLWAGLALLGRKRSYLFLQAGGALGGLATAGNIWLPALLARKFDLIPSDAGLLSSLLLPLPTAIGMLASGLVGDRLRKQDVRWSAWMPALCMLVATPFALLLVFAPSLPIAIVAGVISALIGGVYLLPLYAVLLEIAGPRLRGVSAAVLAILTIFVGQGIGPSLIGLLSDQLAPLAASLGQVSLGLAVAGMALLGPLAALMMLLAAKDLKQDL